MHDRHLGHRIVGHKKVLDVAALQGMSEQHAAWDEVVRTCGAAQDANAVTKAACGTCHRGRYTLKVPAIPEAWREQTAARKTDRAHLQFMLAMRAFMWLFTRLSCRPLSWQVMPLFTAAGERAQPWGSHGGSRGVHT